MFLEALGVDQFHLVGNSLGCVMAARFARLYPERILSLTLCSIATGHAQLPTAERERLRAMRLDDLAALGPQGMAEKRGPRLARSRRGCRRDTHCRRNDGDDPARRLYAGGEDALQRRHARRRARSSPTICKVQFVYGDADVITPPEQNQSVHRERPSAPVHVFPGAGHAIFLEQPEAFNALLRSFSTS